MTEIAIFFLTLLLLTLYGRLTVNKGFQKGNLASSTGSGSPPFYARVVPWNGVVVIIVVSASIGEAGQRLIVKSPLIQCGKFLGLT
jgi:hypothetical protein